MFFTKTPDVSVRLALFTSLPARRPMVFGLLILGRVQATDRGAQTGSHYEIRTPSGGGYAPPISVRHWSRLLARYT
jgi:hypothetical protein